MCPTCGIALGEGAAAWTLCTNPSCGAMEPGAMSFGLATRHRGDDMYRNSTFSYDEENEHAAPDQFF